MNDKQKELINKIWDFILNNDLTYGEVLDVIDFFGFELSDEKKKLTNKMIIKKEACSNRLPD